MKYRVTKCEFNKLHYPELIGEVFDTPPSYARVEEVETSEANRGEASRISDYKATYKATGDHRAAIRSYCAGNKWATENAKAVGNW